MTNETTTARNRFWIYLIIFFTVWAMRATVLYRIDQAIASDTWRLVYSNAVKLTVWVVPALTYLKLVDGVRPFDYTKLTTRINPRGLAFAVALTVAFLGIVIGAESLMRHASPIALLAAPPSQILKTLASVSVSPLLEEIMFRGFVLRKLSEWSPFWRANLSSATLFALTHLPYWLWSGMAPLSFARNMANVFLLGLLFGWVMQKSNSLWPAVGFHIANNFVSGILNR